MRLVDEDFLLYSGEDGIIVPLLSIGGSGVISVLSNVAPKETAENLQKVVCRRCEGSLGRAEESTSFDS